jgi:hypothetical protein
VAVDIVEVDPEKNIADNTVMAAVSCFLAFAEGSSFPTNRKYFRAAMRLPSPRPWRKHFARLVHSFHVSLRTTSLSSLYMTRFVPQPDCRLGEIVLVTQCAQARSA